jgi:hypothetical protein
MPLSPLSPEGALCATLSCTTTVVVGLFIINHTHLTIPVLAVIGPTVLLSAVLGWFTPVLLRLPRHSA